jgi:hypothetical protein
MKHAFPFLAVGAAAAIWWQYSYRVWLWAVNNNQYQVIEYMFRAQFTVIVMLLIIIAALFCWWLLDSKANEVDNGYDHLIEK